MSGRTIPASLKYHFPAASIILLLCIFTYSNTLSNGFLLDDNIFLLGENSLRDVSFKNLLLWGHRLNYRPLVLAFLKLELLLFGVNPAGYHIVNIVLFSAVCYLFYWLLREITSSFYIALLSVCLFAAHPINNFLVNYKTAVSLSIYVLLMQAAFLLFLHYLKKHTMIFYVASLFFYFLSMFAHEISFFLPVYLFFLVFLLKRYDLKRSILLCLPYVIPFFLFLAIRANVILPNLMTSGFRFDIAPGQYVASLCRLLGWYNSKIIFPKNILFIWDEKINEQSLTIGTSVLVAIVILAWATSFICGRGGIKSFLFNIYLTGFIPSAVTSFTFTTITGTAMIEPHWFVFSSIGIFALCVMLLIDVVKIFKSGWMAGAILIPLVLLLTFTTRSSNALWKNDKTYCAYWMKLNPLNGSTQDCLARVYIRENDKGLDPQSYQNCAEVADVAGAYHLAGREEVSLRYYLMALQKNPQCQEAFFGLGNYYIDLDNFKMAEGAFNTLLVIDPNNQESREKLEYINTHIKRNSNNN